MQMELVDLHTGKTLAEAACTNSQTQFGANILDRILAVKETHENLYTLQSLTLDDVRQMIGSCCAQAGIPPEAVSAMTVGGNTTMLHFFLGCDPWLSSLLLVIHKRLFLTPASCVRPNWGFPSRAMCSVCLQSQTIWAAILQAAF